MSEITAVPMEKWGKDHWSLLAYVEDRCVNGRAIDGVGNVGEIDKRRVRANEQTHPLLAVNSSAVKWNESWGSRLRGYFAFADRADPAKAEAAGFQLRAHDDWDCLDDLEAAGLVDILSMINGYVTMTPKGQAMAAQLREHKTNGGQFASFEPTLQAEATPA